MARIYRTARGDQVDFDAIKIKQQLSQAPMTVDVERRKDHIDNKELGKAGRRRANNSFLATGGINSNNFVTGVSPQKVVYETPKPEDFEVTNPGRDDIRGPVEAVPVIPDRGTR